MSKYKVSGAPAEQVAQAFDQCEEMFNDSLLAWETWFYAEPLEDDFIDYSGELPEGVPAGMREYRRMSLFGFANDFVTHPRDEVIAELERASQASQHPSGLLIIERALATSVLRGHLQLAVRYVIAWYKDRPNEPLLVPGDSHPEDMLEIGREPLTQASEPTQRQACGVIPGVLEALLDRAKTPISPFKTVAFARLLLERVGQVNGPFLSFAHKGLLEKYQGTRH
jgi:hypothetical protein